MSTAKPILYFSPKSCAIASLASLEEAAAPFVSIPVTMRPDGAGDDDFRAINPRRQVPVLHFGDVIVRETGAILRFLDDRYPDTGLLPREPDKRIAAAEWLGYLGGSLHPVFRLVFRPARWVGESVEARAALREHALGHLSLLFGGLETDLADREWMLGQRSALDFYLFVFTRWADLVGLDLGPNLRRHHARVQALPALARALARETSEIIRETA